jgi:hypothetical protein
MSMKSESNNKKNKIPGADKKLRPILESGCPLASIAFQYISPSAPGMGGELSHSPTGSDVEGLKSKSSKYLFLDGADYEQISKSEINRGYTTYIHDWCKI